MTATSPLPRLRALALALLAAGCPGSTTGPDQACQTSNLTDITLHNTSARETMRVTFNNALSTVTFTVAELGPGESKTQTVEAGTYNVRFLNASTGKRSCSDTRWTWSPCTTNALSCAGSSSSSGGGGSTGTSGTVSSCHSQGLGYCSYGAAGFCAPYGAVCCGYPQYCPNVGGLVYGTAYNCQRGAPDIPWNCYDRDALNAYIASASCLNARSYACDQLAR